MRQGPWRAGEIRSDCIPWDDTAKIIAVLFLIPNVFHLVPPEYSGGVLAARFSRLYKASSGCLSICMTKSSITTSSSGSWKPDGGIHDGTRWKKQLRGTSILFPQMFSVRLVSVSTLSLRGPETRYVIRNDAAV